MSLVGDLHERLIYRRRIHVLADAIAAHIPRDARVLDVGCGDGRLAEAVLARRADLEIRGADVFARSDVLPVDVYDGETLPYADSAFDAVTVVDVLHHTDDPAQVLAEIKRVAGSTIVIKDHLRNGIAAGVRLRAMDWVGNAPHGVRLPYNYWTRSRWHATFESLQLQVVEWSEDVPLYPPPASWVFGGSLHFVARLKL